MKEVNQSGSLHPRLHVRRKWECCGCGKESEMESGRFRVFFSSFLDRNFCVQCAVVGK